MSRKRDAQGRKWDESDFTLVMEEYPEDTDRAWEVVKGRILDKPKRRRSIPVGNGKTTSVVICLHGNLLTHPCGACEWEVPRL